MANLCFVFFRCAHIFLGKCLPPASGGRKGYALLRTAYGISPDRNLRDRQCSMRMNARANPPVAPGFNPHASTNAVRCLDISTYEKSKLEQLEEDATSNNVRIGAILSRPQGSTSIGGFRRVVVAAAVEAKKERREGDNQDQGAVGEG